MRKNSLYMILAVAIVSILLSSLSFALADDYVTGTNAGSTTFYVYSEGGYSSIDLISNKGLALCTRYYAYLLTYGDQYEEENHGFYTVQIDGPSSQYYEWTPSATKDHSNNQVRNDTLHISFSSPGLYTITVNPIWPSDIQFSYWKEDALDRWLSNAWWTVTGINNCEVSRDKPAPGTRGKSKPMRVISECYLSNNGGRFLNDPIVQEITCDTWIDPPFLNNDYHTVSDSQYVTYVPGGEIAVSFYYMEGPAFCYLIVNCYDEYGTRFYSYDETISESRYVYPRYFDDYDTLSGCEYVFFNGSTCSPTEINFYYQHK